MTEREPQQPGSLLAERDAPLFSVVERVGDEEVVRYFTYESAREPAVIATSVQDALATLGAWGDLDWDAAFDELDRIRHESQPSPPVEPPSAT